MQKIVNAYEKIAKGDPTMLPGLPPQTGCFQVGYSSLPATIAGGYATAYLIHAATAAWSIIRSPVISVDSLIGEVYMSEDKLCNIYEHHVTELCSLVEQLANEKNGMVTVSPLLFFLDTAWIGHATIAEYGGGELAETKTWFRDISTRIRRTGYRPLREPWLAQSTAKLGKDI